MANRILSMLWNLKSGIKSASQIMVPNMYDLKWQGLIYARGNTFPFEKRVESIITNPDFNIHYCTSGVVSNLENVPSDDILFQNVENIHKFSNLTSDFIFCDTLIFYRDRFFQLHMDELVRKEDGENLYLSFVARGEKL